MQNQISKSKFFQRIHFKTFFSSRYCWKISFTALLAIRGTNLRSLVSLIVIQSLKIDNNNRNVTFLILNWYFLNILITKSKNTYLTKTVKNIKTVRNFFQNRFKTFRNVFWKLNIKDNFLTLKILLWVHNHFCWKSKKNHEVDFLVGIIFH